MILMRRGVATIVGGGGGGGGGGEGDEDKILLEVVEGVAGTQRS